MWSKRKLLHFAKCGRWHLCLAFISSQGRLAIWCVEPFHLRVGKLFMPYKCRRERLLLSQNLRDCEGRSKPPRESLQGMRAKKGLRWSRCRAQIVCAIALYHFRTWLRWLQTFKISCGFDVSLRFNGAGLIRHGLHFRDAGYNGSLDSLHEGKDFAAIDDLQNVCTANTIYLENFLNLWDFSGMLETPLFHRPTHRIALIIWK